MDEILNCLNYELQLQGTKSAIRNKLVPTGHSTSNRRRFDVNISTNFHVISIYFFDVISLIETSTSFPRTFYDVTSVVEKSTLFPRTFLDVISTLEKSTLLRRTFFDVISMAEKSTMLPRAFFNVISFIEISTVFLLTFLDVILIHFVCTYLFRQNFDEFDVVVGKL